jgi:hypothetical protein
MPQAMVAHSTCRAATSARQLSNGKQQLQLHDSRWWRTAVITVSVTVQLHGNCKYNTRHRQQDGYVLTYMWHANTDMYMSRRQAADRPNIRRAANTLINLCDPIMLYVNTNPWQLLSTTH